MSRLLLLSMLCIVTATSDYSILLAQEARPSQSILDRAHQMFDQKQWKEARTLYDQAKVSKVDDKRLAAERTVTCAIMLSDWNDGITRAHEARADAEPKQPRHWPSQGWELLRYTREINQIEFSRTLLLAILEKAKPDGTLAIRDRLLKEIIKVDFELLKLYDPDVVPITEKWGWESGYPSTDWWWENVRTAVDDFGIEENDAYLFQRNGIPADPDGQPLYLSAPAEYPKTLDRARTILYLLDEIERLDTSETKRELALAELHRADLMRRVYGPGTDAAWSHGLFYYQYDHRPTFDQQAKNSKLKQFWELADHEARLHVGKKLAVVTLPESVSPMALWQRIEQTMASSGQVGEAIYQRALYYQNRRQYAQAIAEYERLLKQFPSHERAPIAQTQIEAIRSNDVLLGSTGVYAVGLSPKLWYACRNTPSVQFTAHEVDLAGYMRDRNESGDWWELSNAAQYMFGHDHQPDEHLEKFIGAEVAHWSQPNALSDRVATHSTEMPVTKAGAYVVKATVPGSQKTSQGLVIVTGVALLQKSLPGKVMVWAVDARTGRPLAGQQLEVVTNLKKNRVWTKLSADQDGVVYLADGVDSPKGREEQVVLLTTDKGDIAFIEVEHSRFEPVEDDAPPESTQVSYAVTDRPLYRPGDTVHFRVWVRALADRRYQPSVAGTEVHVKFSNANYGPAIKTYDLVTDESGSVTGSFQLSSETALGKYILEVEDPERNHSPGACQFSVEEYKKPEFTVTVSPSKSIARLGEPLSAMVRADYYTGQPVAGAIVNYRIECQKHVANYHAASQWDWLYGNGFGDYAYRYPWLGDSVMSAEGDFLYGRYSSYFDYSEDDEPKELVQEGIAHLDEKGAAEIRFDTAQFIDSGDQEFTITAAVRDESRRTIKASSKLIATRQQFNAFVELDRGWYQPGGQATADINTRSANEVAVATSGTASLYRVTKGTTDQAHDMRKEMLVSWPVKTDAAGHARLTFQLPSEGQYRLEFETSDASQQSVKSESTFWVFGSKFDDKQLKFGGLELIPDKRFYSVGDTAKLLVTTRGDNARVLIIDSIDRHRFIDVPAHAQVFEVHITKEHVPNFFFEATMVHDGEIVTETCEFYVPPVDDLLTINMQSDQAMVRPGEKGSVQIRVTDSRNQPVTGSLALTAFDKALTYIQPNVGPGPKSLHLQRLSSYWFDREDQSLGLRKFEVSGVFTCPEYHMNDGTRPIMGGMGGSPPTGGDPSDAGSAGQTSRRATRLASTNNANLAQNELVEAKLRADFADTATWLPNLKLDDQGQTTAEIQFPESLTTWQVHSYLVTPDTKVGEALIEVKTNKNLIARLQAPRFAVESDEFVLSANVHNYLADAKEVFVELVVPANLLQPIKQNAGANTDQSLKPDDQGNLHLQAQARIESGKVERLDWPVKVQAAGLATISVKARTDVESDAMQLAFPIRPHGIQENHSQAGYSPASATGAEQINFELPTNMDPQSAQVQLTLMPSVSGAAFEALPFLAGYPYGCVEQTMSRFYPTVLAMDTLKKLGTNVEAVANATVTGSSGGRADERFTRGMVFSTAELDRMSEAGLQRLYRFQQRDGGWGWWQHDTSSPYMTAYVMLGLNTAADSDVDVSDQVFKQALAFLIGKLDTLDANADKQAGNGVERALLAYVLSLPRCRQEGDNDLKVIKLIQSVYNQRANLNAYGKALLALTLHNQNKPGKAQEVLQELLKTVQTNEQESVSWIPTGSEGWWLWHNSDIETNAWLLRALVAMDAHPDLAARVANWLVAQRLNGTYWRSTRDSALAVHALAELMQSVKQTGKALQVSVSVDGKHVQDIEVSWENMLTTQNQILLPIESLKPGKHQVILTKKTSGPLHYALQSQSFVKHERMPAIAQHGLRIERRYYRSGAAPVGKGVLKRELLKDNAEMKIGETLEVELTITADKDFEYLAIEDSKPAGFEPIQLRSGNTYGDGLYGNLELHDTKVSFFAASIKAGQHQLRYRLRAEHLGRFSAMPAEVFAMYTPEIKARSEEMHLWSAEAQP